MRHDVGGGAQPVTGGFKVDISRGTRIGRVSSEWFARADDERYLSLSTLHDAVLARDGPFTGDVSAAMLKHAGADTVIPGHSERRCGHHETSAMVAAKVGAAWAAGLATIVCVGENRGLTRHRHALASVGRQSLNSLPADAVTVIAYEPLWAVGSGVVPGPAAI